MTKKPIYLDYAATTPVDTRVALKMSQCLSLDGDFGNPSSDHYFGKVAFEKIEMARKEVADLIHVAPRNIIFTSGATEANNLAIKGIAQFYQDKGKHIITATTEHKSVLDCYEYLEGEGYSITYIEPNKQGIVDPITIKQAFRPDTILVSLMQVNNETGVLQDIEALGTMTRAAGIFLHVDAVQSLGRISLNLQSLPVDLMSFSAHKIYGPKGIGALYINDRPRVRLTSQLHGGGQERKLRAGTLATHQIVGMGEACRILQSTLSADVAHIHQLQQTFWQAIKDLPGIYLNGDENQRAVGILNIRFNDPKNELDRYFADLAVSSASACNSTTIESSHVLRAMGYTDKEASQSLRFSFGRFTTLEEIEKVVALMIEKLRR